MCTEHEALPPAQPALAQSIPDAGYNWGQRALIRLIRFYQVMPRPRGHCRFSPTCSAYAVEAVELHGLLRGTWLAIKRLSRCRPLGGFGFDPVPLPNQSHRK